MMNIPSYHWICCYDIRDPKRLAKVHQALSMLGIALNYSVFYLYLNLVQFEKLCLRLKKILKTEDDLRLYLSSPLVAAQHIGKMSPCGISLIHAQGVLL